MTKPFKKINIMEVCGTHTMAIAQCGIRPLLPKNVNLISGPGCPVCVTSARDIDKAICLSRVKDVVITTFGDLIRVPGSFSSLEKERASGGDIIMVYSVMDALMVAKQRPAKKVVFLGVGFETTSPSVASAIITAKRMRINNFFVLPMFKLITPALKAILNMKQRKIDGFLLPGHVSAVIGLKQYEFIADDYRTAAVVSGFEPEDILKSIKMILSQISAKHFVVENEYERAVNYSGNPKACSILESVFQPVDTDWRAIGMIPKSGLGFKDNYSKYDANRNFRVKIPRVKEPRGCLCGSILLGLKSPIDCSLFGKKCVPQNPVGTCMVSSEGTCAAEYKYGKQKKAFKNAK
jgi:hydrogenase expression/formation protein HypD